MQETDEINVTPPPSPSYAGKSAVCTGRVLCQICFTGCLKKNVKREKLKKISNIEHFKETALRWKNCSYEFKRVHALVDYEKGEKMAHKSCKGTFFKENFLISKEKEAATVASVSNDTNENTTVEDTTSIHSIRKNSRKLTHHKSSLDDRNCIICNEIKYEKGIKVSLLIANDQSIINQLSIYYQSIVMKPCTSVKVLHLQEMA